MQLLGSIIQRVSDITSVRPAPRWARNTFESTQLGEQGDSITILSGWAYSVAGQTLFSAGFLTGYRANQTRCSVLRHSIYSAVFLVFWLIELTNAAPVKE